jgi:hypothetical protein
MDRRWSGGGAICFPDIADRSLADIAHRIAGSPDRAFVMGGVVCAPSPA